MLALTDEFWQDARVHVGSEPQVQISEKHETEHKDRIEQIHSANRTEGGQDTVLSSVLRAGSGLGQPQDSPEVVLRLS